jgi:predicted CopG family antitoxin
VENPVPFQTSDDPRSRTITIRLTEGEREALVKKCKDTDRTFTDYIRRLMEKDGVW